MPDSIELITVNGNSKVQDAPEVPRVASTAPVANTITLGGNSGVQDAPAIPHAAKAAPLSDTATLSDSAKATILQQEGESIEEIAATLGLAVSEVMNDLSIIASPASLTYHP